MLMLRRLLLVAACLQAGCVSTTVVKANSAPPMKAARDVPEQELLDVGIAIFDDGLPESGEERQKLEEQLVFVEVRKAELHNGLLAIELERPVNDAAVRTVRIVDGDKAKLGRGRVSDAE